MPHRTPHVTVAVTPGTHHLLRFYANQYGVTIAEITDYAVIKGLAALVQEEPPDEAAAALSASGAQSLLERLARGLRLRPEHSAP